jgi:hypothetical protein
MAHAAKRPQMAAYGHCALSNRDRHSWLAFLDVDEFVVVLEEDQEEQRGVGSEDAALLSGELKEPQKVGGNEAAQLLLPSLPTLLSDFERADAAAVVLHWRVFGSSGRNASKPRDLSTAEAFTSCLSGNVRESAHVKTIARTKFLDVAEPCLGPHHFSFWDLSGAVDALEREEEQEGEREEQGEDNNNDQDDDDDDNDDDDDDEEEASKKKEHLRRRRRNSLLGIAGESHWTELLLSASPPYPVDVSGKRLDGPIAKDFASASPPFFPAFLAHYVTKSREDYGKKMERGSAMGNRKSWEFFDGVDSRAVEEKEGGSGECSGARRLARRMREAGVALTLG